MEINEEKMTFNDPEIAIVGDLHLGIHQASTAWHNTALEYAKWLKKQLIENNIHNVVLLGDIMNDRNIISSTTLHYLTKFLKILDCFNIIAIVGNHDCFYNDRSDVHSISLMDGWENVTILDKMTTMDIRGKKATFCPWSTDVESIPNSDVLFGHFDIKTFDMGNTKMCEKGIESEALLKKSKLIMTGHFHKHQVREYSNGKIIYTGAAYEMTWADSMSQRGFYILNADTMDTRFVPNDFSPKHKKIRLTELLETGSINDNLKSEFKHNIIRFIIDAEIEDQMLDKFVKKLMVLEPFEFKMEHDDRDKLDADIDVYEVQGVSVKDDIVEYIGTVDAITNKDSVIACLMDVYQKVEGKLTDE